MYYAAGDMYGLKPSDLLDFQIKKLKSNVLLNIIGQDRRAVDELIGRINTTSSIIENIDCYYLATLNRLEAVALKEHVNNLLKFEQDYNKILEFEKILNFETAKHLTELFIKKHADDLTTINPTNNEFLNILPKYLKYISPDEDFLLQLVEPHLKETGNKTVKLNLFRILHHMSKQNFIKAWDKIKKFKKDYVTSQMLYVSEHVPENEHLYVLRAMGRCKKKYSNEKNVICTKVNPALLEKIAPNTRLGTIEFIVSSSTYPFTHKMSLEKFQQLLFPCLFDNRVRVKEVEQLWRRHLNNMPIGLPDYE